MDKLQALDAFWNSFGLAAYDENTVPDKAMEDNGGKFLTYSVATGFLDEPVSLSASLWYKSTSWKDISRKAEEIGREIGFHGKILSFDNGKIFLVRGSPFAQRMGDENDTIRRVLINLRAEFITIV